MDKNSKAADSIIDLHNSNVNKPRAMAFMDYENIYRRLLDYGSSVVESKIVEAFRGYAEEIGINIVDFFIFANFDAPDLHSSFQQTQLQTHGVTTKHTPNSGKNSSDIQMVVDVMKCLYKFPEVDIFLIISSDRDMIPLLQAVKQESKISYLITTRTGFERSMIEMADKHNFIEDVLGLDINYIQSNDHITLDEIKPGILIQVKEIMSLLVTSNIWEKHIRRGNPIIFDEYKLNIVKARRMMKKEVDWLFDLAHNLGWIKLYSVIRNDKKVAAVTAGDTLTKDILKEIVADKLLKKPMEKAGS